MSEADHDPTPRRRSNHRRRRPLPAREARRDPRAQLHQLAQRAGARAATASCSSSTCGCDARCGSADTSRRNGVATTSHEPRRFTTLTLIH